MMTRDSVGSDSFWAGDTLFSTMLFWEMHSDFCKLQFFKWLKAVEENWNGLSSFTVFSRQVALRSAPKHPRKVMRNITEPTTISSRAGSKVRVSTTSTHTHTHTVGLLTYIFINLWERNVLISEDVNKNTPLNCDCQTQERLKHVWMSSSSTVCVSSSHSYFVFYLFST